MTDQNPMLPTQEQIAEWDAEYFDGERQNFDFMMIKAFLAGADCQLEQCITWLKDYANAVEFRHRLLYVANRLKRAMRS